MEGVPVHMPLCHGTLAEPLSRRYHLFKYGRYPLPNDDEEFKRESLRHIMLKELMRGELYLAPIGDNPQKIIDLGTGFGEWAIEGSWVLGFRDGRYAS
jgi:hypothetical protein